MPSRIGLRNTTNQIFCEGEIKLQSPRAFPFRSAQPLEYWSRAITAQVMPTSMSARRGLDLTFSSFATSPLLSTHSAPYPLFQVQENTGNGNTNENFRLWEVSPFDVAVNEGELHASFPTGLLGSDDTIPAGDQCTRGLDSVGYLQGISSYALGLLPFALQFMFCGGTGVPPSDLQACQATGLPNPFRGTANLGELGTKPDVFLLDGGALANLPIWMLLTPQRRADVIFTVEAGGFTTPANGGTFSSDTTPNPATCPAETATCPADSPSTWPGTGCCRACAGTAASGGLGCFSSNDVTQSNLFNSLGIYGTAVREASAAPPIPTAPDAAARFGERVVVYGCNTVSTKSVIVNIPNRIVTSGSSGHDTLKGSLSANFPAVPGLSSPAQYSAADVLAFYQNAKASLPSLQGLTDFGLCVACFYYAKANGNDRFMRDDPTCSPCYRDYCWPSN